MGRVRRFPIPPKTYLPKLPGGPPDDALQMLLEPLQLLPDEEELYYQTHLDAFEVVVGFEKSGLPYWWAFHSRVKELPQNRQRTLLLEVIRRDLPAKFPVQPRTRKERQLLISALDRIRYLLYAGDLDFRDFDT